MQDARTSPYINVTPPPPPGFRSLRWRILTPLIAVLMILSMLATYVIAYTFGATESTQADSELIAASRTIAAEAIQVGQDQRTEANRIAFTAGVPAAVQINDPAGLRLLVEPAAALAALDLVIISGADGREILGLQRRVDGYATATQSDLNSIAAVQQVIDGAGSASTLLVVERRPMLITAEPIKQGEEIIGVVVVGADVNRILRTIKGAQPIELGLFGGSASTLGTTFTGVNTLPLDQALFNTTLTQFDQTSIETIKLDEKRYDAAYIPFIVGENALGVLAVYQPDRVQASGEFGRQTISLMLALLVAGVFISGYALLARATLRINKVTETVNKLAAGEAVRTQMKPKDEIGAMGAAVDRFAAAAAVKVNQLEQDLQQQRRQITHLEGIFENMPDGVIVQDMDGRVMTMNSNARQMIGVAGDSPSAAALRQWTAAVADHIGAVLAPGIHALEETTEIRVGEKVLGVNAAALMTVADKRVGTVILLRDVTKRVQQAGKRDHLIEEIASDVHVSITQKMQVAALEAASQPESGEALMELVREVSKDARSLQRMITEYRDLTLLQQNELRQYPVNMLDVIEELAETWRPVALAAEIMLDVSLPEEDVFVLGEERRLLWAAGNVIDNAIKYSLPGSTVSLSTREYMEQSRLALTIRDQGVGIALEDQQQLFTRFYRGHPVRPDGMPLMVPGTGQGLYLALKVVEAHGGQMALASSPMGGTTVTLMLPLTADVVMEIPGSVSAKPSIWDQPTVKVRL